MKITIRNIIPYTSSRDEFTPADTGGKGWNLFRLRAAGFPVPPWIVLTSGVFDAQIADQRDAIREIIWFIREDRQQTLETASAAISRLIGAIKFPDSFIAELEHTLDCAHLTAERFSVRSSVIGEDSGDHSFAGLMSSRLNVPRTGLVEAIKAVWSSAFSARALLYRRARGIDLSRISTAVIIQEMVFSTTSGVVFSRDPGNRSKECVVAAGYGLGEGVVSDAVETDTYRIGWSGDEVRSSVTVKSLSVVETREAGGGTHLQRVTGDRTFQPVLRDAHVRLLRDMAVRIEREFGAPQDMEWAFDRTGKLFILQARPIVYPEKETGGSPRVWDNSNIVESYPGITLPLTFSFIRSCYEETFRRAALGFVLFKRILRPHVHIFSEMIGLIGGRVYYNLLNWYEMLSFLPGSGRHRKSWDQMIGITEQTPFPEKNIPLFYRLVTGAAAFFRLLNVEGNARKFFKVFSPVYEKYRKTDLSVMDEREIILMYGALRSELLSCWHPTLYNDFCAMKYYDWLKSLCHRWIPAGVPNIHNHLLCGEKEIESVEPVHSAVHIATLVRSIPRFRILFEERDDREIWREIQTNALCAGLRKAIEVHLQQYGDRGTEELKLEKNTLAEQPEVFIEMVKNYAGLGLTVEVMQSQEREIRESAEGTARKHLRNPLRRPIFHFVLRRARRAVAHRENMRFARSRAYGLIRRLFRRLGELLEEKGLICDSADIHYLTVDEIFGIVNATAATLNLRELVRMRKTEYEEFAALTPEERFITHGIPSLSGKKEIPRPAGDGAGLRGIGCSAGVARGRAKVVLDPRTGNGDHGCILVARSTDPGWVFRMISSKGIIVEKGSVLSHTAIIGRELGIPTIIGVKDATTLIPDGAGIEMDGSTGSIQWE